MFVNWSDSVNALKYGKGRRTDEWREEKQEESRSDNFSWSAVRQSSRAVSVKFHLSNRPQTREPSAQPNPLVTAENCDTPDMYAVESR